MRFRVRVRVRVRVRTSANLTLTLTLTLTLPRWTGRSLPSRWPTGLSSRSPVLSPTCSPRTSISTAISILSEMSISTAISIRIEVEMAVEIVIEIVSRSMAQRGTLHPVATLLHFLRVEVATLHPLGVERATTHPPATLPPCAGWWRWRGAPSWDNGTDGTRPGLPAARCPSLTLIPNP